MLTLVTGLPGAGKTCYTLAKVFKQYEGRQIYVWNVDGIDHEYFGTRTLEDPEKWYELPPGAVVVMDEAQGMFPLRKVGSEVPEKCSRFETHRHDGHDVILVTQDGGLLDAHVRKLVGKHFHLRRLFGYPSSQVYEYNRFEPKAEDRNTQRRAISTSTWSFDKEVYDHYHSAEIHTVKKRLPPKLVWVPIILVVVTAVLGWSGYALYSKFSKGFGKKPGEAIAAVQGSGEPGSSGVVPRDPLEAWAYKRTPVVSGVPWSAPMFAEVQKVEAWPKPHCVIFGITDLRPQGKCRCYSQQVTRLEGVGEQVCRDLAVNGWFDFTRKAEGNGGSESHSDPRRRDSASVSRPRQQPQGLVALSRP